MKFYIIFLILLISPSLLTPIFGEINFEDVSKFVGISNIGTSWGSSWGDYNGDGLPDLFLSNHLRTPNIYQNNGNHTFTDISLSVDLESFQGIDTHGASWVDFDNDGDQDLLILTGANKGYGEISNIFLINNQSLMIDEAKQLGIDYPPSRGRTPLWFDWDNDGLLDLLLSSGVRPDGKAPTKLMHQNLSGFIDITKLSQLKIKGAVSSAQVSDLTGDGKFDLVMMTPSTLGKGVYDFSNSKFQNMNKDLRIPKLSSKDFAISDLNGDLLPDLILASVNETGVLVNKLLINTENGFEDNTLISGLTNSKPCRNVVTGDFDNDMDVDIYFVCSLNSKNIPNIMFENLGDGTFKNLKVNRTLDGTLLGLGDSVTTVDFDSDGFLDLFITNGYELESISETGPSQLLRNIGNDNHWIEIDLVGTISNRDAIGSSVLILAGDKTQLKEQSGGMHYTSQNHQRIHAGLGNNTIIEKIIIFFPSGIVFGLENITSDQIITVTEPMKPLSPRKQIELGVDPSEVLCKTSLHLFMKSPTKSLCVNSSTFQGLLDRGWINFFESK